MLVLLELSFSIMFENGCVMILMDNVYYGSGYLLNGFMVLDTVNEIGRASCRERV